MFSKYCGGDPGLLDAWLGGGGRRILEAGCGVGEVALRFFGEHLHRNTYVGLDLTGAVAGARDAFRERGVPGLFLQGDLLDMPLAEASFDLVFSEGVLHHTLDTAPECAPWPGCCARRAAFVLRLPPQGPVREFTDDLVRERLAGLTDEHAWEALRPLTELGRALGELHCQVTVPDVPLLDIPGGTYDVQRLFYWHVLKCFYRADWSFEEMNHVNFDWFRPALARRHTAQEARDMFAAAGVAVEWMHEEEAGIAVRAVRGETP
jgi:SAM-dependent methyltransferase